MTNQPARAREGSLEAPTRHPIDWRSDNFWSEEHLFEELERVFDICHGCRRCFNLCHSFPTLFDAVDEGETGELDSVPKEVYWDVVDHCYLCDMCYMSKCPYVPPHEFNVDFPHLMLRAKAQRFKKKGASLRDKVLSAPNKVGKLAGIPVVAQTVNAVNKSKAGRAVLEKTMGVDRTAPVPKYHSKNLRKRLGKQSLEIDSLVVPTDDTRGQAVLFTTCYGNYNEPDLGEDLLAVFHHAGIPVQLADAKQCCGMPKWELGDLKSVEKFKNQNIPALLKHVEDGYDIVAPIPSCVLMFKQELPLMFPDDEAVLSVQQAIYDPFEYLMLRHKAGLLPTDFNRSLGKIAYHVACHLRVQNIGLKTRDVLSLIPDTEVQPIERCSGHDGTYAVKKEFRKTSIKIARPVVRAVDDSDCDYYASDCPMAGHQIASAMADRRQAVHPMKLLRMAYGL